ncbi:MAG: S1 family peptidase [Bdellovibrionia bacterium]
MVKWLGVLSVVSLQLLACSPNQKASTLQSDSFNTTEQIINGTPIQDQNSLPKSVVAVYDASTGQLCSGALLPNNIVLTAAHCIGYFPEAMYIVFDTEITTRSTLRSVDKIKISEYWDLQKSGRTDTGDLALLHYVGTTPLGYVATPLLNSPGLLRQGTEVILAGFGVADGKSQDGAGILRMTTVKIADPAFSNTELKLDQRSGSGACHGDSGGPAFIKIGEKYFVWGIASRGAEDEANDCSQFSIYTSAVYYKTWIERNAKLLSRSLVSRTSL